MKGVTKRKWARRAGIGLAVVALGVAGLVAVAWAVTGRAMSKTYAIHDPALQAAGGADAVRRGRHLFATRGCTDCHAANGAGRVMIDDPLLGRVVSSNLTRSVRNPAYTDDALAAAIRHGVRHDGTPLLIMPAGDFANLDDADVAAIVAYLRALPPVDADPGTSVVRPFGRVLYALGKLPLFPAESLDHAPRPRQAPVAAVTPDYGRYIAQACTGCHGGNFAGGPPVMPGTPPPANLTPHPDGLARWSEADFLRLMHTGHRPDGRAVDEMMPWRAYSKMEEVELRAIWAYLRTVDPTPGRARLARQ